MERICGHEPQGVGSIPARGANREGAKAFTSEIHAVGFGERFRL